MSNEKITIRKMMNTDIDQVLNIEHESFATPWSREAFVNEINENPYAHYFVIENEQQIIGYCGLWLVIDDANITNIAILPSYRGKKLGDLLFKYVLQYAKAQGAIRLSLEVRLSNRVAQGLYRKYGLIPGGIRKNYYVDNQEDALVMWVNL